MDVFFPAVLKRLVCSFALSVHAQLLLNTNVFSIRAVNEQKRLQYIVVFLSFKIDLVEYVTEREGNKNSRIGLDLRDKRAFNDYEISSFSRSTFSSDGCTFLNNLNLTEVFSRRKQKDLIRSV